MEQNTQIVMNMGLISTMKGNWETAIKEYTRAIAQNSYLALAYVTAAFRCILHSQRGLLFSYFQRGYCYYRLERYQEAEADFCTAEVMLRAKPSVYVHEDPFNGETRLTPSLQVYITSRASILLCTRQKSCSTRPLPCSKLVASRRVRQRSARPETPV
jgi:hypothetical protein